MKTRAHDETDAPQDDTQQTSDARTKRRSTRGLPGGVRVLDLFIVAVILGLTVFSGFAIYGNRGEKPRLVIESPAGRWLYDLDSDLTVQITGPLGDTTVEIRAKQARIVSSPCPNQTCVAAHAISRPGAWNACLPNEVMIRVENAGGKKKSGEIDAFVE